MAYQSLYRRYRSGKFDELVGQKHVVTALKNAIVDGRVGHAYLFSGPRGTGKTSTARILGKALNCTNLGDDGEPCTECDSCLSFATGTSYDLQELDAASNNGVEAIRDLIGKVALGSPGRTKVYILDEVHMLTSGAENALLKTLEEPPDHVVFVLATTEPHKVVPTIRSRTQHFEFELIPAEELGAHVRWIADDAGLSVTDEMIDYVLRVGGGSARDTLSALDQVVAAGGIPRDDDAIEAVLGGLAARDASAVVAAVSEAIRSGRDPRVIGETMLGRLRDGFLSAVGAPVDHLSDGQAAAAGELAKAMGPAAITRALEVIGTMLIDMRQAPDPRVDLEVAVLRLSKPELDTDLPAVLARIERLEQGGVGASAAPPPIAASVDSPAAPAPADASAEVQAPAPAAEAAPGPDAAAVAAVPAAGVRPADGARAALASRQSGEAAAPPAPAAAPSPERPVADQPPAAPEPPGPAAGQTLGARRGSAQPPTTPVPETPAPVAEAPTAAPPTEAPRPEPTAPSPAAAAGAPATAPESPTEPVAAAAEAGTAPLLTAVEAAWPDIKSQLPGRAKSRFSGGRFLDSSPDGVVFGLPNAIHRDRCADCVGDVEAAMSTRFGQPVTIKLVVDGEATPPIRVGEPTPAPKPRDDASGPAPTADAPDEVIDMDALTDADNHQDDGIGLLTNAFPGAEVVDPDTPQP